MVMRSMHLSWNCKLLTQLSFTFRLIGDTVYQGEITEREKKNGDKVKEERNKTTEDNG